MTNRILDDGELKELDITLVNTAHNAFIKLGNTPFSRVVSTRVGVGVLSLLRARNVNKIKMSSQEDRFMQ